MSTQKIDLINLQQARLVLRGTVWPLWEATLAAGTGLHIEWRTAEDAKTDKQRRYLHGYVLKTIAQQALVNGERFDLKTWKEWFRSEFLGFKVVTYRNPKTGKKVRRRERQSTEALGTKGYAEFTERVMAYAASELGVEFTEEWTDPETGEVFLMSNMRQRKAANRRMAEIGAGS